MRKMISRKKTLLALLIALVLALGLVGCKKGSKRNDEYQPTSGLVLTEAEAAALNGKIRAVRYYPAASGDKLMGEVTLIEFTAKDRKAENLIIKVLNSLIQGPKDASNMRNLMPKDSAVKSVKITGDCVTINFNAAFKEGMPELQSDAELLLYSIANTITEFKDFNCIKITSGNEAIRSVINRKTDIITNISETSSAQYSEEAYADVPME